MRRWLALALLLAAACGGSEGVPERGERAPSRAAAEPRASGPGAGPGGRGAQAATEDAPLPDVALPDLSGRVRPLRERAGEVTLINFWATWCVPCLREIPVLVALQDSLRTRGLHVVGVAIDSGDPGDIREFAARYEMNYAIRTASHAWARRHFGVFGLPVSIVVDRQGRVRRRLIGPQTRAQFEAAVREFL